MHDVEMYIQYVLFYDLQFPHAFEDTAGVNEMRKM